jgi:ribosomal protein S18 acetylase RimI-like enzyme
MSSPPSLPRPEPIRFRRLLHEADPRRIGALVAATGVFSKEEIAMAALLAQMTLDKTEVFRWILAESDGELLGYTCYQQVPLTAVSWDLYWIAVAPAAQRAGLAQKLIALTAEACRKKSGLSLYAETSSREPYAKARAFYRKAGFVEAGVFPDFYDVGDAKVVFRLGLRQ